MLYKNFQEVAACLRAVRPHRQAPLRVREALNPATTRNNGADEETLEKIVGVLLSIRKKTIAVAESCTGGLVSHRLTNVPGSSHYFQGSVVAYSDTVKTGILRIPLKTVEKFGAVSWEIAQAMAKGVRKISGADLGLAITGIAGPGGGSKRKPVGLVYTSLATNHGLFTEEHRFSGKRETIKSKASQAALYMVRRHLLNSFEGVKKEQGSVKKLLTTEDYRLSPD